MTQETGLAPELLAIIVCPECHAPLQVEPDVGPAQLLICLGSVCGLRYPVRDGIPILLVDEAERGS